MRAWAAFPLLLFCVGLGHAWQSEPTVGASKPGKTTAVSPEEHKKLLTLWRDRADAFTNASLEDIWNTPGMLPVLRARLADAWWKLDGVRAQAWLKEAIDDVLRTSPNEPERFHKERLNAAQIIFPIVDRHDRKAANKILAMVIGETKSVSKDQVRLPFETQGSIEKASEQAIEEGDLRRAEQLGDELIAQQDPGRRVGHLVDSITAKDQSEGDRYYLRALTAAASANDFNTVSDLLFHIFSDSSESPVVVQRTVDIVSAMLTKAPLTEEQETAYCEGAPLVMTNVRSILPTSQIGQVDAALLTCQNKGIHPPGDWRQGCETSDECLELASQTSDPEKSAGLKWEAAAANENGEEGSKAVDILLSYTPEEKKAVGQWESAYLNFAVTALQQLYMLKDSHGIQQILDRSPEEVRPGVMLQFVRMLAFRSADRSYASSLVRNARVALENHPVQNPMFYLDLIHLYTVLMPEESPQAFGFAVAGLNQIDYTEIEKERAKRGPREIYSWHKPGYTLEPNILDGVLIERDEPYVTAAVKSLDDPETRIAFRLTFLNYSLKKYEDGLHKSPITTETKASKDH